MLASIDTVYLHVKWLIILVFYLQGAARYIQKASLISSSNLQVHECPLKGDCSGGF